MRLSLTSTFENMEDETPILENGVPLTSKIMAIRVLNKGAGGGTPESQGGVNQEERLRRGKLSRRFKKMNGHISLTPEELVLLKKCSHEMLLLPHIHDQFCDMVDGCEAEPKE